jgi:hypothetical protein
MKIIKPPDIKINPYTGKPMAKQELMWEGDVLDVAALKKWFT